MCSNLNKDFTDTKFYTIVSCKYPDTQTDLIMFKVKEEGVLIKTMVRIAKHNLFHK